MPIIEIGHSCKNSTTRLFLVCRDPQHGGILRRQMLGSSLTTSEIAQRTIEFTQKMCAWYRPQISPCIVVRCEAILL